MRLPKRTANGQQNVMITGINTDEFEVCEVHNLNEYVFPRWEMKKFQQSSRQ